MAFKNKNSTPSFVITLPLDINVLDQNFLYNEFGKCGKIYNLLVTESTQRWHQLRKTRAYKNLMQKIKATPKGSKILNDLYEERRDLLQKAGLSQAGLFGLVKKHKEHFHVHAHVAQSVASSVWKSWEKFLYGNGKAIHYKRLDEMDSISGMNNDAGIMLRPWVYSSSKIKSLKMQSLKKQCISAESQIVYTTHQNRMIPALITLCEEDVPTAKGNGEFRLEYSGHRFPIVLRNPNTPTGKYQADALKHAVKYCRITRKWVGSGWKYYAQLVLEGRPPEKHKPQWGELCADRIGLDIGTQTIAISGKSICDIRMLAPSAVAMEKSIVHEIALVQRAMDRSRRTTNPEYFNEDGTIKKLQRINGRKQIRKWKYSKHYLRLRARYRDLNRKLADIRKQEHYTLANDLLKYGNNFVVEKMSYKALQKRAKETRVNAKTGRIQSKKRFGKSIFRCAPAAFIEILSVKAKACNGVVTKVSTFDTKASQYDHTNNTYQKKDLSERFAHLSDGTVVQRDIYSAYLLAHVNDDLVSYNLYSCKNDFPEFLKMYDCTKKRLQERKDWLPASVGF